jgi:putative nucleotidyltransferase with HDIG domain
VSTVSAASASAPRHGTAYVAVVNVLGAAVVAYSVWDLITRPPGAEWLILVVLTVVSGYATLRIPAMPISFSISDTFNIAAALLFGPAAGAVTAALDGLVLSTRMLNSRRSADRVLFNMAAPAIATWGAAAVFFACGGDRALLDDPLSSLRLVALLTLFGALDFGLNSGIVAMAVAFEQRTRILPVWREHFLGIWVTYFGGVFGALLLMVLARMRTLETLILILPLPVILYVTFRHALGRAQDQISHLGKVNKVYVAAIEALAQAIDAKDQVTHDHIRRVQDQAVRLARALAVDDDLEIQAIKAAALLHDVGKLAVPEHILNKPGRLTGSEFEIMKRHAPAGADILSVIGFPYPVAPIVRHHHENWDGTGYPDGISGERIPIGARIIAVVDCFDALTSDRPYRPRLEDKDALQILTDRRGTMYDPRVVDVFFSLHGADVAPSPAASAESIPALPAAPAAGTNDDDAHGAELRTFYDLGRAMAAPAAAAEVGHIVWEHLRRQVPACAFVFYTYDAALDAIVAAYEAGEQTAPLAGAPIALGERLSGWVAANRRSILNSDARLDFDEALREASLLRSALAAPIVSDGRCLGVFTFYARQTNAFDESHRRIVQAAAHAVAGHPTLCGALDLVAAAP